MKKSTEDLTKGHKARKRLALALKPRDKVLSLRFNAADIESWRAEADKKDLLGVRLSLTDCIEEVMNRWVNERHRRRGR